MLSIAGIAGATLAFVNFAAPRMVLYPAPKAGDGEAVLRAAGGSRVWLDVGGAKVESWRLPPLAGGVGADGKPLTAEKLWEAYKAAPGVTILDTTDPAKVVAALK